MSSAIHCKCYCHRGVLTIAYPHCCVCVESNIGVKNSIFERIEILETKINFLRNDKLNFLRNEMYEARIQFIDQIDNDKKPYKCPVCLGSGKYFIDPSKSSSAIEGAFLPTDERGIQYRNCRLCNGVGVMWDLSVTSGEKNE